MSNNLLEAIKMRIEDFDRAIRMDDLTIRARDTGWTREEILRYAAVQNGFATVWPAALGVAAYRFTP